MKKNIVILSMILAGVVSVANAGMSTAIGAANGIGASDGLNPIGQGALVYLVWSADLSSEVPAFGSLPSDPTPGATSSSWGTDYLLNSYRITTAGDGFLPDDGAYTYGNGLVGGANIESGYAYLVIFETPMSGPSYTYPVVGTWYRSSSMFAVADTPDGQPQATTTIDLAPSSPYFADQAQVVAVPEPSSMALLAIGLGIVALRRVRRS